jgi:clan AA aspartic protease
MALIKGSVTDELEPVATVRFTAGRQIECLIDTGFSGALVLPLSIVAGLNLPIVGHEDHLQMIGGEETSAVLALAEVDWLEERRPVVVIVKDDYLLGAQLLEETQLFIDYPGRALTILRDQRESERGAT